MKLKSITILNFKGIKSLKLDLDGESASILGDNGTGKTSIYDAFLFLLFGKDSRGSATFSIKPIVDGEPLHNVETHVEAELDVDGKPLSLIRKYREVWARRRGDAEDTFTGHETLYYVDNLPTNQANYKKVVESIMPENLFRALTNPFYFPETMKWQDRRSQLFKLFGGLTDDDVAQTDERFVGLLQRAGRNTVEDYSTALKVKIRGFNQTLKELPARMDEVARQILDDDDDPSMEDAVETMANEIRELKASLEDPCDQTIVDQRRAVEEEILQLQRTNEGHRAKTRAQNAEGNRNAMNDLSDQIAALKITDLRADLAVAMRTEKDLSTRLADLRARFTAVASETYTAQDKCPTCGRPFPAEDLQAAKDAWEAHRMARLDAINAEGRELAEKQKTAKQTVSDISEELTRKQAIEAEYQEALQALRTADLAQDMDGYAEQLNQLTAKRDAILEAMQAAKAGAAERNKAILELATQKQGEYIQAKNHLAACKASKAARLRMEELRAQQTETVDALEDAEAEVALCEEFVRARVSMVEESINRNFDLVKWQLYRDQINGGLEEICEATVNGIPYHDLNGAMRINAGLDIIYACSRRTGQTAPIFVDNAESVTDLFVAGTAQVIRLVVSEADTQLRLQK